MADQISGQFFGLPSDGSSWRRNGEPLVIDMHTHIFIHVCLYYIYIYYVCGILFVGLVMQVLKCKYMHVNEHARHGPLSTNYLRVLLSLKARTLDFGTRCPGYM